MQQFVQGALSALGLIGQNSTNHKFDTLGLETLSRTLSLPSSQSQLQQNDSEVSSLDAAALLAWLLLLQREGGEDDKVEAFNWGRRSATDDDGTETSSQFSVKLVLGSEGLDQMASVKCVLEAISSKVTGQEVAVTEEKKKRTTLFFNDGKEAPDSDSDADLLEKIKEEGYETAQRPVCFSCTISLSHSDGD